MSTAARQTAPPHSAPLLGWLNRSLSDKRAYTYEQYASIVAQELIKNDA